MLVKNKGFWQSTKKCELDSSTLYSAKLSLYSRVYPFFKKLTNPSLAFFNNSLSSAFSSNTAQKMKVSIKDFPSKCDQIRRKLQVCSHLLKKSLMENFIFYAIQTLNELPSKYDIKMLFLM